MNLGTARCAILAAATLLAGPAPTRAQERLRLAGSGSALGTMILLGQAFERANPGVRVEIRPGVGTGAALRAVQEGALEIALAGRPLKEEERRRGLSAIEVARTPAVFVVRAGGEEGSDLSAAELARILRGERPAWPNGVTIWPVLRPAADADTLLVRAISPELSRAVTVALARPGMLLAATNQQSDDLVVRTPGALGLSTLAQLTTEGRPLAALRWEGVEPTLANLAAGRYPLAKPLLLVLPAGPTPAARAFVAFSGSAEGRRLLTRAGNLPSPGR